ncbi:Major allergen Asp f 2 [Cyphellophora attinorum]|uniref:Major allergen Asp f 2 n=1 Tax=Cyphellophora attinorum TaxID=1664694 RepID=A0A0N0NLY1_9EURO|nr:Major allergen Asp f 2 [Phialophora attinorum]KPI39708.1 Major allergen Asp f 2 [Phialophora attinorum]
MASFISKTLVLAATAALAAPAAYLDTRQAYEAGDEQAPWNAGAVTEYTIHESCNATQASQIADGLREAVELAEHAKAHILRWGNESEIYRKYFGNDPPYTAIGSFDIIGNGDKAGVIFRCDNPDGNCEQEGWAGHWRGSNATQETVICDLSYINRRWLSSMCGLGYNVANSPTNTFWASDLLHRLYHIPSIGNGYIEHFLETYQEILDNAGQPGSNATHDSDVLQYFALEAYAYDVAVPGEGCSGEVEEASTTAEAVAASTTVSASSTLPQTVTGTMSDSDTHEGGELHCDD